MLSPDSFRGASICWRGNLEVEGARGALQDSVGFSFPQRPPKPIPAASHRLLSAGVPAAPTPVTFPSRASCVALPCLAGCVNLELLHPQADRRRDKPELADDSWSSTNTTIHAPRTVIDQHPEFSIPNDPPHPASQARSLPKRTLHKHQHTSHPPQWSACSLLQPKKPPTPD